MRHLKISSLDRARPGQPWRSKHTPLYARVHPRGPKLLAAMVVAVALAGSLSSCSTAPTAATVNGAQISEEELTGQLQLLASDPAYTKSQDEALAQAALQVSQQTGQQAEAFTVAPFPGLGQGSGDYDIVWVDIVLSNLIAEKVVDQYFRQRHIAPGPAQLAAAWASEDASGPEAWQGLTPAARTEAAFYDAERALLEGPLLTPPAKGFYQAHTSDFWSQVCVTEVDVPIGQGGPQAAKRDADALAKQLSGQTVPGAQPVLGASFYCDTPEALIEQSPAFQQQVNALAPGHAAVLRNGYGFQVVEVRSRSRVPLDDMTGAAIQVVVGLGGALLLPEGDAKLVSVLKGAHVQVNPRFGNWSTALPSPCPPSVVSTVGQGTCYP